MQNLGGGGGGQKKCVIRHSNGKHKHPYIIVNKEWNPKMPGNGTISWSQCSQCMQAGCEPYPPQTGFDLKRLFDYEVKAIPWSNNILKCQCSKGCLNTAVEYMCYWKNRDRFVATQMVMVLHWKQLQSTTLSSAWNVCKWAKTLSICCVETRNLLCWDDRWP